MCRVCTFVGAQKEEKAMLFALADAAVEATIEFEALLGSETGDMILVWRT